MRDFILDLQLFAAGVPGDVHEFNLNTNKTTDSALTPEMKTFYDMALIDEASPQLVHDQFAQKRPIPQGSGKKIEFRKFASLPKATTALQEGVTPDGKKLSVSTIEATVSQYGDYIVQSDVLELTAIDNTILEATKILGRQAGLTLDTITRNILNSGVSAWYAPKIVSGAETAVTSRGGLDATAVLTVKLVEKVAAALKAQNAPKINGSYVAIIHPYAAYSLMRDPEWIAPHNYQDTTNLYEGEIGKIGGVRFVESSEAKVWKKGTDGAPSGQAVFSTIFVGEGAYGVTEVTGGGLQTIVKQKGSAGTADPLDQRSSVGWKAMKTAEILVPNYIIRVESTVPDFADTESN